jgi:hypothetical protein
MLDYADTTQTTQTKDVSTTANIKSRIFKQKLANLSGNEFLKRSILIFAVILVISGMGLGLWKWSSKFIKSAQSQNVQSAVSDSGVLNVPVNRDFEFKAYDKNKKLADNIKYTITDAQLTNQIIIKGQSATAVKGRQFLILNLKLVSGYNDSLFLNTRNYVRIQPLGETDKLAPEIHNDTVEVQPLSTKLTRIGLPVNNNTKSFILFVGELDGEKQEIDVNFP